MSEASVTATQTNDKLGADFWKFFIGETISALGGSFTGFALPLVIYRMTHSALNLALATVVNFLPFLIFGLVIGAWMDQTDRKRLMVYADIARGIIITTIPLFIVFHMFSIWWIYVVMFLQATLGIVFNTGLFAVIPRLVNRNDLVTANGRLRASFSITTALGPLLAGVLVLTVVPEKLLFFDGASFLVSAFALAIIKVSFNADTPKREIKRIGRDVVEGLQYVLGNPILRNIALVLALVNFIGTTTSTQMVLFAKTQYQATDSEVALLFAAGSAGITLLALSAGWLRKRLSLSILLLGTLMLDGLLTIALTLTHWFWFALLVWGFTNGLAALFNINTNSLRQTIVPDNLLGRVMTTAGVLAWSAIPAGALIGGLVILWTNNVAGVYAAIGVAVCVIAFAFWFTELGHADRVLQEAKEAKETKAAEEAETAKMAEMTEETVAATVEQREATELLEMTEEAQAAEAVPTPAITEKETTD